MRGWARWARWGGLGVAVLLAAGLAVGSLTGSPSTGGTRADMQADGSDVFSETVLPASRAGAPMMLLGTDDITQAIADESTTEVLPGDGFGDRLIKETTLTIEVEKDRFAEAWNAAHRIAREGGGEVIGSSRGTDGDPIPLRVEDARSRPASGTLTIRVPADALDRVSSQLRSTLGEVRSEFTSSQDVSQEYVDLQSRRRNLRAEESALLELFARARNVRDTLAVRQRLSNVRGELEQVVGRMNFIESRTAFSVIRLNLAEPGAAIIPPTRPGDPSFGQAWETALEGLIRIGTVGMIAGIWLAPFALISAVALRFRRRVPGAPPPAPQA